jgi:hypothetical protein
LSPPGNLCALPHFVCRFDSHRCRGRFLQTRAVAEGVLQVSHELTALAALPDAAQSAQQTVQAATSSGGIFAPLSDGLESILRFLQAGLDSAHVPYSYGWSIILLTLLVKVVTFPLTKQQVPLKQLGMTSAVRYAKHAVHYAKHAVHYAKHAVHYAVQYAVHYAVQYAVQYAVPWSTALLLWCYWRWGLDTAHNMQFMLHKHAAHSCCTSMHHIMHNMQYMMQNMQYMMQNMQFIMQNMQYKMQNM